MGPKERKKDERANTKRDSIMIELIEWDGERNKDDRVGHKKRETR